MKIIISDAEVKELPIPRLPMPSVDDDGDIVLPGVIISEKKPGRTESSVNKTQLEKELIALDAMNPNLTQTEVAKIHGTQQSSVSSLARGWNDSSIDKRSANEGVREVIKSVQTRIAESASDKLLRSLEHFEPACLDQKDLPGAALKLSNVLEKTRSGFQQNDNAPRFIVYSPRVKEESSFEVVDVQAQETSS